MSKYLDESIALEADEEALEEWFMDGVVPACCTEDCMVEPDGYCPHGCPSVFVFLGVI